MYYNIYLFVVIAFKSMMIYNTVNMLYPQWIIMDYISMDYIYNGLYFS